MCRSYFFQYRGCGHTGNKQLRPCSRADNGCSTTTDQIVYRDDTVCATCYTELDPSDEASRASWRGKIRGSAERMSPLLSRYAIRLRQRMAQNERLTALPVSDIRALPALETSSSHAASLTRNLAWVWAAHRTLEAEFREDIEDESPREIEDPLAPHIIRSYWDNLQFHKPAKKYPSEMDKMHLLRLNHVVEQGIIDHAEKFCFKTEAEQLFFEPVGLSTLSPEDRNCSICTLPFGVPERGVVEPPCKTSCKHIFGSSCLRTWVLLRSTQEQEISCPTCRATLTQNHVPTPEPFYDVWSARGEGDKGPRPWWLSAMQGSARQRRKLRHLWRAKEMLDIEGDEADSQYESPWFFRGEEDGLFDIEII